jgi:hypothetical protein
MPTRLQTIFETSERTGTSLYLKLYRDPAITAYNRLEPRARTEDFTRSLRAEVRDPLWMLTRQWQMGEFEAEDAGSAIDARLLTTQAHVDRVALRDAKGREYDLEIPLETMVEREHVPFTHALRVQVGHYFLKLHTEPLLRAKYAQKYLQAFPFEQNLDEDFRGQVDGLNLYTATKARDFDGEKLLQAIADGTFLTTAGIDPGNDQDKVGGYAQQLIDWFKRQYAQPVSEDESAWEPSRLTYRFKAAAPKPSGGQLVLDAGHYHEGRLDWYSFELDQRATPVETDPPLPPPPADQEKPISFLPTSATFKGMPNPRFWEMEDRQINFGNLNAKTTDQLLLVFAELGLIYGNDWFVIPYSMEVNTLCEIRGLVVTDVFGDRTLVQAADEGADNDWQRWSMFNLSNKDEIGNYNRQFFLPAALTQTLESEPLELVNFMRDEMANMVWAVEERIPDATGIGINGNDAADKTGVQPPPIANSKAAIRYVLGTTVPENWIPFLPVHEPGSVQQIRFQRAAMPKLGMPPKEVIKAKGVLLNEVKPVYYINEEEIPNAGTLVRRSWQRTRWHNGRTYLWIGRYRETGRGQGSSNLRFDQIEPVKK